MFFVHLNAQLDWPEKRPPYVTHAVYAHAAVMHAITATNPSLGQQLHNMRRDKPLSLAFIGNALQISFVGQAALRYMEALMTYWQATPVLKLGDHDYNITGFQVGGKGSSQVKTWPDLTHPSQHKLLRYSFLTPTALTRQDSQRQRYTIPYPEPTHFFNTLIDRWHELGGPQLPEHIKDYLADGGCVLRDYKLHTNAFPIENHKQIGFVGNATYLCRQEDDACIQALNWVTRLAPFVGIGYQTARGMGAVETKAL